MLTVIDALAPAARAAAAVGRRGQPLAGTDGTIERASENGITLEVRLEKQGSHVVVIEARHQGAGDDLQRGVLEVFCTSIEGLPLREAADHGAIHALATLRGDPLSRSVGGILMPRSAGTAFTCCERLIRAILARYLVKAGERRAANFWNAPLSKAWRERSDDERIALLEPVMKRFRVDHRLSDEDIWITAVEKTRRIVIGFGAGVDYHIKPALLMALELDIRRETGDQLELFMSEAKDSNPIRRLAPEEERS